MPLRSALKNDHSFGPEDVADLTAAYEAVLAKLGLVRRADPMRTKVATLVIELAKNGERDPDRLCDETLKILDNSPYGMK